MFDFISAEEAGEDVIEAKPDYDIKMDGNERTFEDGFVRYTKEGKGRYDLIPMYPFKLVLERLETFAMRAHLGRWDVLKFLSDCDYVGAICGIISVKYEGTINAGAIQMMKDLAVHYEKGAEKYGENNWRKATNETWSFIDSGTRHTMQFLSGEIDEPHHISAIWNFFCYLELTHSQEKILIGGVPLPESWKESIALLNCSSVEKEKE